MSEEKIPKCEICGTPFILWDEGYIPREHCRLGHPPRAERVVRGLPKWMIARVNKAYGLNFRTWRNVAFWMDNHKSIVAPGCLVGFFDHDGHDKAGNYITEPYGRKCKGCHRDAEEFAEAIGAKLTISNFSFHAPWSELCIRMTFSEEARG